MGSSVRSRALTLITDDIDARIQATLDRAKSGDLDETEWRTEIASILYLSHIPKTSVWAWASRSPVFVPASIIDEMVHEAEAWIWRAFTGRTLGVRPQHRDTPPKLALETTVNASTLLAFVWNGLQMQMGSGTGTPYSPQHNHLLRAARANLGLPSDTESITVEAMSGDDLDYWMNTEGVVSLIGTRESREPVEQTEYVNRRARELTDPISRCSIIAAALGVSLPERIADSQERTRLYMAVSHDSRLALTGLDIAVYGGTGSQTAKRLAKQWLTLPQHELLAIDGTSNRQSIADVLMSSSLAPFPRKTPTAMKVVLRSLRSTLHELGMRPQDSYTTALNILDCETAHYDGSRPVLSDAPPEPTWRELFATLPSDEFRNVYDTIVASLAQELLPTLPVRAIRQPSLLKTA